MTKFGREQLDKTSMMRKLYRFILLEKMRVQDSSVVMIEMKT